jgi:hypothetical protein
MIPSLRSIRVTLEPDAAGELDPQVVFWAHRDDTDWQNDHSWWDFSDWKVRTFPTDVWLQFGLSVRYEANHGR